MYLLVDVLEHTEHLPAILEGFARIGVTGTTVLDSLGMGRILMKSGADIPAIDVIREVLAKGKSTNKTIFAVIRDKQTVEKAIEVIKSFCGDLAEPGKGILFTISLEHVEGLVQAH
jgi:nitrogen regulatory protein PII